MSIFFLVAGIAGLILSSLLIGFLIGVEKTSREWHKTVIEYQKVISMYQNMEKEKKEEK